LPSTIEQVHREFRAQGLTVLAINIMEPPDTVAEWTTLMRLSVLVLLDADGAATTAFKVRATPTVVLVAPGGRLVGRAVGVRAWLDPAGRDLLRALTRP
jgi:hypothetical protein